jgi:hypothetical protein
MDSDSGMRAKILHTIEEKTSLQTRVFDNTFQVLTLLKEVLQEMSAELNDELDHLDKRIRIEYRDRGKFEAQLSVGADTLIFSMHTNVFEFNREHAIWQNPYVRQEKANSYCGVINIYNFLTDSFKYNRNADEGYLIGRIFVNRENRYFVEGKRQISLAHNSFGGEEVSRQALQNIVETAILYSLEFDLLVPPYDTVKIATADQMNTKIENSKMQTGKRLGYVFNSDDI